MSRLTRQTKSEEDAHYSRGQGILVHWGTIPTKGGHEKLMQSISAHMIVTKSHPNELCYTLDLPLNQGPKDSSFVPCFQTSHYISNDEVCVKFAPTTTSDAEDNRMLVDEILAHQWNGNQGFVPCQWNLVTHLGAILRVQRLEALDRT